MADKLLTVCGRAYQGEILHQVALGCVVVFPSWMSGVRAEFVSMSEAMLFVDAHLVVDGLFSSLPQCTVEA